MRARVRCRMLLFGILAGVCFGLPTRALANDDAVRRDMHRLASEDAAARREAIANLRRTKDPRLAEFFSHFQAGSLFVRNGELVLCNQMLSDEQGNRSGQLSDPMTGAPIRVAGQQLSVPERELRSLGPTRRERRLVRDAIVVLRLYSPDHVQRRASAKQCGDFANPEFLPYLEEALQSESDAGIRETVLKSILLIRLRGQDPAARLAAARELGAMRSSRALPVLTSLVEDLETASEGQPGSPSDRAVYELAIGEIESYQKWVRGFRHLFSGISLGSILILMALGLSVTFGLMGVINMAHGELMMIGAYATYETQCLFVDYLPEGAFNFYFVLALPVAFASAALVGFLIEILVVRHLYGRPLETLLATWGVGLVLIQSVRLIYGNNIGVNSPTWLRGGAEVVQDLTIPYNRCFIIVVCSCCVLLIYGLLKHTKLGLLVRATTQSRETADSLGVNTRRIDGYTFALGSGVAGIAGWALTLIGGVTPDMGQTYIVDSFLVVVTGGVGELAGVLSAGLGMGLLNKFLEPFVEVVWAKVLILTCVILFIQWRPAGLFPPKGRLADV